MAQAIETSMCSPFIGKTVTVSGQLAASTSTPHTLFVQYSTTVDDSNSGSWTSITAATTSGSLTPTSTTFVSFANTYAIPSTAKTVRVALQPTGTVANGVALYYGNIQLEVGSSASTFSRAGATIQGELAACQRYYRRLDVPNQGTATLISGFAFTTTVAMFIFPFGIEMRIPPSALEVSNQGTYRPANATAYSGGTWALNQAMNSSSRVIYTHGSAVYTAGESLMGSSTATANYFAFSAEL
jgi:hypothetical protein